MLQATDTAMMPVEQRNNITVSVSSQLLSCPHCRCVKIWSLSQYLCTAILVHEAAVVALQLSALLVVSACRDGAVCLWNQHNPHSPLMQWKTTDGVYFSVLSVSGGRVFGAGRSE